WVVVVNPRAGAGRAARRLEELRAAARDILRAEVRTTDGPGHATVLARELLAQGFDGVAAVGGDGTANEVVNGMMDGDRPRNPDAVFATIHAGTGGDLVKTLAVPSDPAEAMRALARGQVRPIDLLHLRFTGHDGAPQTRIGVNVTGFGLSGEVVQRANRSSKRLGPATFAVATAAALRTFDPPPVTIEAQTEGGVAWSWSGRLSSAFVANGAYCGGGMWVGRGGAMDDGWADLTVVPDLPLSRMVLGAPRLFTGTIDRVKGVSRTRISTLRAISSGATRVSIDVDGEQPGFLPIEIRVLEKVLRIAQ
ncbi:MAG: diacylglycerol kinase family protein, partial [Myxococcota bacterium]